jgi:D-alanyl-lipoteichoic acid acyltransferase DltB (MBOAT superfamily)
MNLMFNFCRVSSLACAVHDGKKLKKLGEKAGLKKREVAYAIVEGTPSFLDYWCYMFFCGACISGPWYEFRDFQNYMQGKEQYSRIPSTVKATLERIMHIFLLIAASIALSSFDDKYYLTQEFKETPFANKLVYMFLCLLRMMATYLIGFCFMECGSIASGFSYNGTDEKSYAKHDRI